jgi:alkylhydroperoxidase family enzyme
MDPMFLPGVEHKPDSEGAYADLIRMMRGAGQDYPQIWHLFAFKPGATKHLERFTHEVMRGPSPLTPSLRELIAAYTSARNQCPF